MRTFNSEDIEKMDKIYRINLINGITGIKPANLIGTKSEAGISNLAIFSSVVHMGSKPPIIGMFNRPSTEHRRDTLNNIIETGYYTINHIGLNKIENAHYTSAKFDAKVSEFEACDFEEEYLSSFPAPFVKGSKLKFGLKLLENKFIDSTKTNLVIGQVEYLSVANEAIGKNGEIDLEKIDSAGIGGLNQYYKVKKVDEFPYARVEELPKW